MKTNTVNFNVWQDPHRVREYRVRDGLQKPEEAILSELRDRLQGKTILDIGVGGGRTCGPLRAISTDYVGIDYSPAMVTTCRERHPDLNILRCDARDLSVFANDTFDFVLFSFNGIDSLSHAGRLTALGEIRRVIRDNGWFAFSSHNRDSWYCKMPRSPFPPLTHDPWTMAGRILRTCRRPRRVINYLRNSLRQVHEAEYAIINEPTYDYSLLTYYISVDRQLAQLRGVGFNGPTRVYGLEGDEVASGNADPWLYYLTRKTAHPC